MEELSKRLRERRKELGYDLREVVEETKLHPSVIKSLESGQFHKINPVYLKGFIKIYATFLGIDVSKELKKLTPPKETSVASHLNKKVSSKNKIKVSNFNFPFNIKKNIVFMGIIGFAFIIIFILLFSIIRLLHEKIVFSKNKSLQTKKIQQISNLESKSGEILVSFKVKRDCFIEVEQDGRVVFEGVLKRGAVESWQANKELEFRINDGSSVEVEVNGKLLPPLTKIHKPIRSLKVTTKGISIVK